MASGLPIFFYFRAAGKLRIRIREEQVLREMTLEGVVSILEGMNPRMLETKLLGFLGEGKAELAKKASVELAR